MIGIKHGLSVGSPVVTGLPVTVGNSRFLKVGSSETYTTIEAAVAALTSIAPDVDDPYYMLLVDSAYTLTDDQIVMPANSGIIAADPIRDNTLITCTAGRNYGESAILCNSNNIFSGFSINGDNTGDGCPFGTAPSIDLNGFVVFSNLKTGLGSYEWDTIYAQVGGDYYFYGCDITVSFDGIAMFGNSQPQTLTVDSCRIIGPNAGTTTQTNLIRNDNNNLHVDVINSQLEIRATGTMTLPATCIGSGIAGTSNKTYSLNVADSTIKTYGSSDTPATHGYVAMTGINKNTGSMDLSNVDFIMVNDLYGNPVPVDDIALKLTSVADYSAGISDCRIYYENIPTVAGTQVDGGGNTITGFKIT